MIRQRKVVNSPKKSTPSTIKKFSQDEQGTSFGPWADLIGVSELIP